MQQERKFTIPFSALRFPTAFFVLLVLAAPLVYADVAAPPPMITRLAHAETIVVGSVIGNLDQDVAALPYPTSKQEIPYRIALVKIDETIQGKKAAKIIRVGYPAPRPVVPGQPVLSSRGYHVRLPIGSRGILFLKKHFKESFFLAPNYYDFINSNNNKAFDKQLDEIKRLAGVSTNASAKLKSKNAETRLQAAAVLISKYRTVPRTRPIKTEPIDAGQSKLILKVLTEADWNTPRISPTGGLPLSPQYLFAQLGIGANDGFRPPRTARTQNDYRDAVRTWLRENGNTYRIKRYVSGEEK